MRTSYKVTGKRTPFRNPISGKYCTFDQWTYANGVLKFRRDAEEALFFGLGKKG